jgi:outer membrane protein assembly factor BamE (lipoprotein component of BamABCDE complex)
MERLLSLLFVFFLLAGCASLGSKQKSIPTIRPYWEQEESIQDCLKQKKVCRGMSKEQVQTVIGKPTHVSEYISNLGNSEVWIYGKHPDVKTILYFGRESKVNSITNPPKPKVKNQPLTR